MAELTNTQKEIAATVFMALLAFGLYSFYAPSGLGVNSYAQAMFVQNAINGAQEGIAYTLAASWVKITGLPLTDALHWLMPLLGALAVAAFFLMARSVMGEYPALFSALLLAFMPSFAGGFQAGFFSAESIYIAIFTVAAAAAVFTESRLLKALRPYSAAILPIMLVAFAAWRHGMDTTFGFAGDSLLLVPLALAACLVPFKLYHKKDRHEGDVMLLTLGILGLALLFYDAPTAAIALCLAAGAGVQELLHFKNDAKSAYYFVGSSIFLFTIALLMYNIGLDKAAVLGVMFSAAAVFAFYLYRDKKLSAYAGFGVTVFGVVLLMFSSTYLIPKSFYPVEGDWKEVLAWVEENTAQNAKITTFARSNVVALETGRPVLDDDSFISSWLLGSQPVSKLREKGVRYLVLDGRLADDLTPLYEKANSTRLKMDSFGSLNQYALDDNGNAYLAFATYSGLVLYAPADKENGRLVEGNAIIQGQGEVPFSKLIMLKNYPQEGFTPYDRFVYPREGFDANLLKLLLPNEFGALEGAKLVNQTIFVRVYEIY